MTFADKGVESRARDIYVNEGGLTTVVRGTGGKAEGLRFIRPRVYSPVFQRQTD